MAETAIASERPATGAPIEICEVGPRDGLQNLSRLFTVDERAALITKLAQSGLRRIEAVSFVNPRRVPQMADAKAVLDRVEVDSSVRLSGLVMNRQGAERAVATRLQEIRFVVVASETFSRRNQNAGIAESLAAFSEASQLAKNSGKAVTGVVGASFGCPFEGAVQPQAVADIVAELVRSGADEIVLADTIGVGVPREVRRLAELCQPLLNGAPLGFHFHNTRNTGYANAVAAIEAGATILDASIGGLGGCSFAPGATGNIATEDLTYLLQRSQLPCAPSLDRLLGIVEWLKERVPGAITGQLGSAGAHPRA